MPGWVVPIQLGESLSIHRVDEVPVFATWPDQLPACGVATRVTVTPVEPFQPLASTSNPGFFTRLPDGGAGWTTTVRSSLEVRPESSAVSRSTYVPSTRNCASVLVAPGAVKFTAPGPLTLVQAAVLAPGGVGRLSSLMKPFRVAEPGSATVWSAPANTEGAAFVSDAGLTSTVTSSAIASAESLEDSRRT